MKLSCRIRSCGETVPMLLVELDALAVRSNAVGMPGDEYDVAAPPPKPVKSSRPCRSARMDGKRWWLGRGGRPPRVTAAATTTTKKKTETKKPSRFILPAVWGMLPV